MSGCSVALSSGRYTWCHNRVLKQLVDMIDVAWNKAAGSLSLHPKVVTFFKEGDKPSLRTKISQHWSILDGAKDWKIAADIKGGEQYPRIIYEYQQFHDIMLWSWVSDGDNHHRTNCAIWAVDYWESWIQDGKVWGSLWSHTHTGMRPSCMQWRWVQGDSPQSHCGHWQAELGYTLGVGTTICMPCVRLQRLPLCGFGGGRMTVTGNSMNCEWRCAKHWWDGHPLMRIRATLT